MVLSKQKKIKLIISILIIIFGTLANIYFSTLLDQIFSGKEMGLPNMQMFISSIKESGNHLKLFISLELLIILLGIFYMVLNDKTYQSDLIQITPNISTPVPAGQKQFGSARWMTHKEKPKAFPVCIINRNDSVIDYLVEHGYDDLMEGGDKNI